VPIYNKLVRDHIPQVIKSTGKGLNMRILDEEEYRRELITKLKEETKEYVAAENQTEALEELADILEVIRALAAAQGATWEQLEEVRKTKEDARGGFQDRVYLLDVDDA
jgi:predicted house-cleaning noncanonical NTP pyrophosphatase (MazG superfamily)